MEFTVPYETSVEEQREYRMAKYQDLLKMLIAEGLNASIFAVEMGIRGFVAASMYSFLNKLYLIWERVTKSIKDLVMIAENVSCWIWCKRDEV